ncbi:HlyD family secretion protein [Chloroflexota bacterium]
MKRRGILGILLLVLFLMSTIACSSGDEETTAETVNSDINVTVTGDGNIEASSHARLTFGSGGKVDEIAVKEGDKVSKGDVLARLDTGALELAEARAQVVLTQAQVALTQAQVALTQVKLAGQTAENNLKNTQDTGSILGLALLNAQIDIKNAEYSYNKVSDYYTYTDIRVAEADVAAAELYLEDVLVQLGKYAETDVGYARWSDVVIHAQARIKAAEDRLEAMRAGLDPDEVAIKKLLLEAARKAEVQAQRNLDKLSDEVAIKALEVELAEESVEHAQQNVNLAQHNVDLAQKSLAQAQKYLGEATIVAPFDGTVANIGAKEGEFLSPAAYTGTPIVEIIDLSHMELTARVNEVDIVKVKTGQKVMISVDAMPGTSLEGRVTFISPVARDPGAVLFEDEDEEKDYEVKIDFDIPNNSPIKAGMSATAEIIVE